MKVGGDMTRNQRIFCDEYLIDLNATRAYKAAYKNVTKDETAAVNGSRLLRNAKVKAYIDKKMEEMSKESIADAEEVLKYLTSVLRGEEREQTLMGLGGGEQKVTEIDVSAKDRIKAAELIGKRYSLFTDRVDIEGNVGAIIIDDIPDV